MKKVIRLTESDLTRLVRRVINEQNTESQMNRAVLKYINSEYGDLEPYETDEFPDYIFFMKDGKVIFEYHKKNGNVYFAEYIWELLESFFGLEFEEIKELTKEWVEEHYNLNVTASFMKLNQDRIPSRDIDN